MKLFKNTFGTSNEIILGDVVSYINQSRGTITRLSGSRLGVFNATSLELDSVVLLKMKKRNFSDLYGSDEYIAYDSTFSPIPLANYINDDYTQFIDHPRIDFIRKYGSRDCDEIEGTSYYMGPLFKHYGHFLIETLSRYWRALETRADVKDFKFVFHVLSKHGDGKTLKNQLFLGYWKDYFDVLGITEENLEFVTKPTVFEHLIIPQCPASLGDECIISPKAVSVWRHLNSSFTSNLFSDPMRSGDSAFGDKIYISRRKLDNPFRGRKIANEKEIENLFKSYGFKIVFPEKLTAVNQHALLANCRWLVGMPGSGMLNGAFLRPGGNIVLLVSQQMNARNPGIEHTISVNHMAEQNVFIYANEDFEATAEEPVGNFDRRQLKSHMDNFNFDSV